MVLGVAQRMGGCGDTLFTALVVPAAVFLARPTPLPSATAATAAAVYIFVSLVKFPPLLRDSP